MKIQDNILLRVTNQDIIDGKFIVPEGVVEIEWWAFNGCASLTKIILPEGIKSIGKWAFDGCTSLTQIELPEGLVEIGNWAFQGCTSLQHIELPWSLVSIGNWAFRGCTSLNDVQGSNRELVNQVKLQALIGRKFPETYLNKIISLTNK